MLIVIVFELTLGYIAANLTIDLEKSKIDRKTVQDYTVRGQIPTQAFNEFCEQQGTREIKKFKAALIDRIQ